MTENNLNKMRINERKQGINHFISNVNHLIGRNYNGIILFIYNNKKL